MAKAESEEVRVIGALESPKYKWRTINGIAKDSGVSVEVVKRIITANSDKVVMASVPSVKGEPLYTSRESYRRRMHFFTRISAALKNRGD